MYLKDIKTHQGILTWQENRMGVGKRIVRLCTIAPAHAPPHMCASNRNGDLCQVPTQELASQILQQLFA